MGKKKKGGKKKKKGGGFALRGDPPEAEIKTHDIIRAEGLQLYDSMAQQIFTMEAPSYVNFLYQKEQAALAAANADKPKKAAGKGKKGSKKKGKKGSKKKGKCLSREKRVYTKTKQHTHNAHATFTHSFLFSPWFLFCFLLLHVCFWSHRQEKEIELVKLTTAGNGLVQQPVDAPETVPFSVVHTYTHTHKQETDTQSLSFKLGMCDNSTKNTSCD